MAAGVALEIGPVHGHGILALHGVPELPFHGGVCGRGATGYPEGRFLFQYKDEISLVQMGIADLAVLGVLAAPGIIDDLFLEEFAKLGTGQVAVFVYIAFPGEGGDELTAEDAFIGHGFLVGAGGDELTHRFGGLGGDMFGDGAVDGEQGAGETTIEQEQGVFGVDAEGIFLDTLHGQGQVLESDFVLTGIGGIAGHDVPHGVSPPFGGYGMAMPGEIEKEAIFGFPAMAANEFLEGLLQLAACRVEDGFHMKAILPQGTGHGLDVLARARQFGPTVVITGDADNEGVTFPVEPHLLPLFVLDDYAGNASVPGMERADGQSEYQQATDKDGWKSMHGFCCRDIDFRKSHNRVSGG